MNNQNEMILSHLRDTGSITAREAIEHYGCYRLGARIYDLRQRGVDIRGDIEVGVNRYGKPVRYKRYWMVRHD